MCPCGQPHGLKSKGKVSGRVALSAKRPLPLPSSTLLHHPPPAPPRPASRIHTQPFAADMTPRKMWPSPLLPPPLYRAR